MGKTLTKKNMIVWVLSVFVALAVGQYVPRIHTNVPTIIMDSHDTTHPDNVAKSTENAARQTSRQPYTLGKRVRLIDIAAISAVGGGKVLSFEASVDSSRQPIWEVRIERQGHTYNVVLLRQDNSIQAIYDMTNPPQ